MSTYKQTDSEMYRRGETRFMLVESVHSLSHRRNLPTLTCLSRQGK